MLTVMTVIWWLILASSISGTIWLGLLAWRARKESKSNDGIGYLICALCALVAVVLAGFNLAAIYGHWLQQVLVIDYACLFIAGYPLGKAARGLWRARKIQISQADRDQLILLGAIGIIANLFFAAAVCALKLAGGGW